MVAYGPKEWLIRQCQISDYENTWEVIKVKEKFPSLHFEDMVVIKEQCNIATPTFQVYNRRRVAAIRGIYGETIVGLVEILENSK